MSADEVTLARIVKARGIRGEVAADSFAAGADRFLELRNARLRGPGAPPEGMPVEVEGAWEHGGRVILKFSGIDTMSDAERLAGLVLCVPELERAPAAEGEFHQSDLTGAELVDRSGRLIGRVTGWKTYGGPDLLEVKTESGKEILVPFARSICVEIDAAAKRIVAELPEGLTEL